MSDWTVQDSRTWRKDGVPFGTLTWFDATGFEQVVAPPSAAMLASGVPVLTYAAGVGPKWAVSTATSFGSLGLGTALGTSLGSD